MLLKTLNRFFDDFFLVVQQTELQECVCLCGLVPLLIGNIEQLLQMLNSLLHISILGMRLRQLSVSLSLLVRHISLLRDFQEPVQVIN